MAAKLGHLARGAAAILCLLIFHVAPSDSRAQAGGSGGTRTCISRERDALLSFKAGLLDPAGRLSSWHSEDCCMWEGVRCSNRTGHVVKLDLRNTHDDGNCLGVSTDGMGSSLAALLQVRYLDLSGNDFNGTSIPVFVGSLEKLRYLNLSWSGFSGRIPSQLGNLSNLQALDVSWNLNLYEMDSSLAALQQVRHLDLSGNNFNGTIIPMFVGSLEKLRYLNLSWSGFGGRIPSQLGNLSNLQALDVSCNLNLYAVDLAWLPHLSLLSYLDLSQVGLHVVRDWVHMVNMLSSLKVLCLQDCDLTSTMPATSKSNLTHLQVLDLSGNPFNTSVGHNWFWDLTSLKELYLSGCKWHGPIPEKLGNMTSLEVLYFCDNDGMGLIPSNLQNLCNLKVLYFEGTNINASIGEFMDRFPRCSWSTLQELLVSNTNMNGELPIWIGNMTSLSVLSASENMITGLVPLGVGALGNLTVLALSSNKLNGVLMKEHFSGLLKLEELYLAYNLKMAVESNWVAPFRLKHIDLRSCLLGPRFPEWLRWQTDINYVLLRNTNLDDVIPDWFWVTFSRASWLDASENMLRGSLPANLQHMSAAGIGFRSNNLTGQVPQLFSANIKYLDLSSNSFSGPLPSNLKAPLLNDLLLSNNQITGTVPSSMCQLTRLEQLDLSGNSLTGDVMQCWKESDSNSSVSSTNSADQFGSRMYSLALNNNDLTGEFPKFLHSASTLMFLDLSYNRFFGTLPKWLPEKMPDLHILRVRSNMFSGRIPKNLTCLENLYYLDMAHNNISGTIPWSLSNWKAMRVISRIMEDNGTSFEDSIPVTTKGQTREYTFEIYTRLVNLDLSCNSLTGMIPEEICLLNGLTNLNLSNNQLVGKIPNQIGDLKQLESLDLSYNEFSDEIPSGLSALTSLSHLNLSYNNLSGAVPSGQQLQVLDNLNYTYIGNPGLCGYPLPKNCSASSTNATQSVNHEDADHISYLYLGMGIGFVVGLWVVFCTMLLKRTWAIAYFQVIDKLYDETYVRVVITWARLMKNTHGDAA